MTLLALLAMLSVAQSETKQSELRRLLGSSVSTGRSGPPDGQIELLVDDKYGSLPPTLSVFRSDPPPDRLLPNPIGADWQFQWAHIRGFLSGGIASRVKRAPPSPSTQAPTLELQLLPVREVTNEEPIVVAIERNLDHGKRQPVPDVMVGDPYPFNSSGSVALSGLERRGSSLNAFNLTAAVAAAPYLPTATDKVVAKMVYTPSRFEFPLILLCYTSCSANNISHVQDLLQPKPEGTAGAIIAQGSSGTTEQKGLPPSPLPPPTGRPQGGAVVVLQDEAPGAAEVDNQYAARWVKGDCSIRPPDPAGWVMLNGSASRPSVPDGVSPQEGACLIIARTDKTFPNLPDEFCRAGYRPGVGLQVFTEDIRRNPCPAQEATINPRFHVLSPYQSIAGSSPQPAKTLTEMQYSLNISLLGSAHYMQSGNELHVPIEPYLELGTDNDKWRKMLEQDPALAGRFDIPNVIFAPLGQAKGELDIFMVDRRVSIADLRFVLTRSDGAPERNCVASLRFHDNDQPFHLVPQTGSRDVYFTVASGPPTATSGAPAPGYFTLSTDRTGEFATLQFANESKCKPGESVSLSRDKLSPVADNKLEMRFAVRDADPTLYVLFTGSQAAFESGDIDQIYLPAFWEEAVKLAQNLERPQASGPIVVSASMLRAVQQQGTKLEFLDGLSLSGTSPQSMFPPGGSNKGLADDLFRYLYEGGKERQAWTITDNLPSQLARIAGVENTGQELRNAQNPGGRPTSRRAVDPNLRHRPPGRTGYLAGLAAPKRITPRRARNHQR